MSDEEAKPEPEKEGEAETAQPPEAETPKGETPKEEVPPEVWQRHTERFKKEAKKEMAEEIAKSLGMKVPEGKEADPIESLTEEVKELKKQVKLREWESRNPFVLSKENEEKWTEALKKYEGMKNSKGEEITYDEIAKLAGVTKITGKEEVHGSVPSINRVVPKNASKAVEDYRNRNKDIWKFE